MAGGLSYVTPGRCFVERWLFQRRSEQSVACGSLWRPWLCVGRSHSVRSKCCLHMACWAAAAGGTYYFEKVINYMFWVDIALNFRTGCARIAVEHRFDWQPCRPCPSAQSLPPGHF